jgi:hypothetical protein
MKAQGDRSGAGASSALIAFRWLLLIALAVAAITHVRLAAWWLGSVADQSARFYVTNVAIDLGPALAYAAAVVLALTRRGGRVTWSVLLACGLTLSAISLFYLLSVGFGELMLAPPCLVALSLVQLLSRPRTSAAEAR